MKIILAFNILLALCVSVWAGYKHGYGAGHGGGHGFYGYPVGRKWGYSTYIQHPKPKPKHHVYDGHIGYGGAPGFGDFFGYGIPGFSHGYSHQPYSHQPYGHGLNSSRSYGFGAAPGLTPGHEPRHKNHNYGDQIGRGAHSKTYHNGFGHFDGLDFLGNEFPNNFLHLMPENLRHFMPY